MEFSFKYKNIDITIYNHSMTPIERENAWIMFSKLVGNVFDELDANEPGEPMDNKRVEGEEWPEYHDRTAMEST